MNDLPTGRVTFLFTDIEGSTTLVQEVGTDRYRRLQEEHSRLLRQVVTAHGGRDFGTEGDAHHFVFVGAAEAVRAAIEGQRTLGKHEWPPEAVIRVRMGLHTGEVHLGGDDYVGVELNRVARISAAGHGGQILVSEETRREAQPEVADATFTNLGRHRLKDLREPEHLHQLHASSLQAEFPPIRSIDTRPKSLPAQLTSFVGREREVDEIAALASGHRLVTLAGPGGSGKTRLAVSVADRLLPRFDDGVFFVPLAPVFEPDLVPSTVASVLGLREGPESPILVTLQEFLRDRGLLLVLDNFEHILQAAPLVTKLLEAAPRVEILVTSRTLLRVQGEHGYEVPPLPVPSPNGHSPQELSANPAVRLFVERAAAIRRGFVLNEENASAVAEVVRKLDGLPLAIELASARIRILSAGELLARLDRRLGALTGGGRDLPERQRTLRGTIDWSHDLLDPEERRLFARVSIFAGGWSREGAEAVGAEGLGIDVLDGLESLVEKSLVHRVMASHDEIRFDMLETIREYARERLEASGDGAATARRHARYLREQAERAEPNLTGPQADRWLDQLRHEVDNIRTALRWALDSGRTADLEPGLLTAAALWRYWQQTGAIREANDWFSALIEASADPDLKPALAKALDAAGSIAYWQNDIARASELYERALALAREVGDRRTAADALTNVGLMPLLSGDIPRAQELLGQAVEAWKEVGDEWQAAIATVYYGYTYFYLDQHEEALRYLEEIMPLVRERGDRFWMINALTGMAQTQRFLGRYDVARRNYEEAIRLALEAKDMASVTMVLDPLSNLESTAGNHDRAVRLWAASDAVKQRIGGGAPQEVMRVTDPREAATAAIGEEAVSRAWRGGQAMTPEEAVRYATGDGSDEVRNATDDGSDQEGGGA